MPAMMAPIPFSAATATPSSASAATTVPAASPSVAGVTQDAVGQVERDHGRIGTRRVVGVAGLGQAAVCGADLSLAGAALEPEYRVQVVGHASPGVDQVGLEARDTLAGGVLQQLGLQAADALGPGEGQQTGRVVEWGKPSHMLLGGEDQLVLTQM